MCQRLLRNPGLFAALHAPALAHCHPAHDPAVLYFQHFWLRHRPIALLVPTEGITGACNGFQDWLRHAAFPGRYASMSPWMLISKIPQLLSVLQPGSKPLLMAVYNVLASPKYACPCVHTDSSLQEGSKLTMLQQSRQQAMATPIHLSVNEGLGLAGPYLQGRRA